MIISFRPHHFLCTLCFQGRGYSPAFISNFQFIVDQLHSPDGDKTQIQVVNYTDSICQPCPNRIDTTCITEEKINRLDHAHSAALNITANDKLTWDEAKKRISTLTIDQFHQICATCEWKKYGICEQVLTEFLNK